MSFFEDASLVLIPSAYKDQKVYSVKPTDGTGDLTFSRASGATRVASNGLIEKVRTNLLLQSNTFNAAAWVSAGPGATVTSGQSDPDSGNSAWLLSKSGTTGRIEQNITTAANEQTFSISAKKGTANFITINVYDGTTNNVVYFNLNTGVVGSQSNGVGSIVSLGSGWFRCSVTSTNLSASGVIELYISDTDASVTGATGNIFIYESQFENGVATDYIATTTAAVSVGPVSGLPRLDYLGSTCPRLLLEPQRTNVIQFSDGLVVAQAFNGTLTKNNITSPDGYVNASLFTPTPNANAGITTTTITTSAISYTFSIYLKGSVAGQKVRFFGDLQNVTEFTLTTSFARYTTTFTGAVGAQSFYIGAGAYISPVQNNPFYLYGCQLEEGAYATSYIPTLGASVTRVADAASKTGISSLIGQTEGTLFLDFNLQTTNQDFVIGQIYNSSTPANSIYFYITSANVIEAFVDNGGNQARIIPPSASAQGNYKLAIGYKANDFVYYINGVQIGTDTSGTVPTCNSVNLIDYVGTPVYMEKSAINQYLLFTTRLSNAQLAELTA
jgi:hypothetical protein